ncbi:hypothetical protein A9G13_01635 [Gilliamella sp. wkB178]|uniref:PTS sugar transporter subunit IIA n=1 Tax=Gilliamella sp. wkB178 TaxID=3120259 RepID=UPI00080EB400|nr:PTS sugar transporter subunit IIA [Gilliamella apicola]OCG08789.1 hypothetical protein A9G13_01635 [Gilliamella apicola]
MNKEIWLFVCAHGRLGFELVNTAQMIVGELENVYAFSLESGMAPEEFGNQIETKLKEAPGEVLCLVDLFGGTPCNQCVMLSRYYNLHIISGVNLPMLIELYNNRNECEIADLITRGLDVITTSCKDVLFEINN